MTTDNKFKDRIEIESLNIVGAYAIKEGKATDDECLLCRRNLSAPSFEDLQKGNLKGSPICILACNHAYHKTCIDAYNAKDNISCPIDRTPLTLKKVVTPKDYNMKSIPKTAPQTKNK